MKKLILGSGFLLVFSVAAMAQNQKAGNSSDAAKGSRTEAAKASKTPKKQDKQLEAKKVELTPEQMKKAGITTSAKAAPVAAETKETAGE